MLVPFQNIPTFDCQTKSWTKTSFNSQSEFALFVDSLWSDTCDFYFDEDSLFFNEKARHFEKHGFYTDLPRKSRERKEFWKAEGEKCVKGVIYKGKRRTWFIPNDYYFIINYFRISNKEKGFKDTFLDIRDIQYYLSLYEKRAELHNLHALLTKKRQMASSLYHCGKLLVTFWFVRNSVNKIFASDSTYINTEDGIWKFLNKGRDFLNEHTDWFRNNNPNVEFKWIQQIETTVNGKKIAKGRMSVMSGITLNQSPTKSVGGAATYGYHEESGIAPKLDVTYGYFRPAVESGVNEVGEVQTVGMFIAAGSVGDLKQCQPLKRFMYAPTENKFLAVNNHWASKERIPTKTGLFIPEHWGLPGFIDQYGNSDKEAAFVHLNEHYKKLKANPKVTPQAYQLELSQRPMFLDDAFRHREVSYYPASLLQNQQDRIELKDREDKWLFKPQKGLLKENPDGKVVLEKSTAPEHQYPIKPEWEDKRGCVTIYSPPDPNPPDFMYFAGVDTIEADNTKSSESIFSMDIFQTRVEVSYEENGKIKKRIEGDKLVATYRGRFDSAEDTNYQGWLLLKMYNAYAFVERSKPNFISYMQRNGRANKYLAKESDVPLFKDQNIDLSSSKSNFGFILSHSNQMLKNLKEYLLEYLVSEYSYEYKANSEEVVKTYRGVDRIDDYWLLEELIQYNDDDNFDRHISFSAAVMIAKIFQQNRVIIRSSEVKKIKPHPQQYQPKPISMLGNYKTKRKSLL